MSTTTADIDVTPTKDRSKPPIERRKKRGLLMKFKDYIKEGSYSPDQMRSVMFKFKEKYPDYSGPPMNITDMDMVLAGHKALPTKAKPPRKPRQPSSYSTRSTKMTEAQIRKWIDKAEMYVGDMMYELAQQKVKDGNDSEAVMRKVEMLSKADMDICRHDALIAAAGMEVEIEHYRQALTYWKKRGF